MSRFSKLLYLPLVLCVACTSI